jgi:hypothetical protein
MLQSNLHCAAIEVTENTNRPLNQGYDGETRQELEEHLLTSIDTDPVGPRRKGSLSHEHPELYPRDLLVVQAPVKRISAI